MIQCSARGERVEGRVRGDNVLQRRYTQGTKVAEEKKKRKIKASERRSGWAVRGGGAKKRGKEIGNRSGGVEAER